MLILSGELTLDDGDIAFGRYVDQMIEAGRRQFVIDLSGVNYIDSAGVGMLVAESKRVTQHGGAMRLARLTAAKPSPARDAEAQVRVRGLQRR